MTMKRYIRQILLGTLLLGMPVPITRKLSKKILLSVSCLKTRQLPSTKRENDDEISVLIFRKEKDQFTKVESIQESPWLFEQEQLQKNILLPTGSIDFCWQKDSQTPRETLGKYHL